MAWELTEEAFERLLACFDSDRDRAGEKYEDLRRALIRFFEGRGIFAPEECVDEVFNRAARRLSEGVVVVNIYGYCQESARFVLLERFKSPDRKNAPLEEASPLVAADGEGAEGKEAAMKCLDECLNQLPEKKRELILAYYQDDKRDRINRRRALAEQFSVRRDALANQAQRLRNKLEQCITECRRRLAI
jgi:DNA-directed RNA polymerase specialized sigma24 family protein